MTTHDYTESWANGRRSSGEEAWFRSLIETVLYVDRSDASSSAVYVSPQSKTLFGYSRGEWLGDPELWIKMLHPEDRERVLAAHELARRAGAPFREEYRLIGRDGSVVWVRDEAVPVDDEGGPRRRAGVLLDITERKLYEEKFTKSEERYRKLLENAMEGIARISAEGGTIEQCNPVYARVLGLTPEECVGRSFFEFVDGEDEEEVRRQRELRLQGIGSEYEVAITAADGKRRVLSCGGYALHGPDGAYEGAVQTVSDVTDRKRHERDLQKSEERFRLVARATGEAIWDNDLTTGVQVWDGATEALFGYPPRRCRTGKWWEERINVEDRERVLAGLTAVLDGGGEVWEEEYRFRRADGSQAHVLDRGRVVRDATGEPVRMVGAMADVTERREHEEELRRSEELFRGTFEAAAVGIAHVAPDGRWLRINDELCRISGYPREELLGTSYLDFALPEDSEAGEERLQRLLDGRIVPYSAERQFVRKDGSRVWINLSVSLVRTASGEPGYFVCVAEDITARKVQELGLTDREAEVLSQMAAGSSNPRIARELALSLGTVKLEVRHVLKKLRVNDRVEAAARAVETGLHGPGG